MTHTTKHTPGPWAVEQCSAPVYGSDGSIIAKGIGIGAQSTHIGTVYGKNSAHNAHLIAAAPAMYEALKAIQDTIETCYADSVMQGWYRGNEQGEAYRKLRAVEAALAQAEGNHD